jgi:2-pyrone-4,6-dicarboxylate lactonase
VFGPRARFPFDPGRSYTPAEAPKEALFALRDHLGFARNVIVQAACHGRDNSVLLDALAARPAEARGVALLDPAVTDRELAALDAAGVRGIRFTFMRHIGAADPAEVSARLAARVADLGWHVLVYFQLAELESLRGFLTGLPGPVVIDHMGRPDIAGGLDGPEFTALRRLMEDGRFWAKVSCGERISRSGPPWADALPFQRRLVQDYPDRVLWGTDWPHPNIAAVPDDGLLVDNIPLIAPDAAQQRALLVENPARLYWASGAGA